MKLTKKQAESINPADLSSWILNRSNKNKFLSECKYIPHKWSEQAVTDFFEHQCRYMGPAKSEIIDTAISYMEKKGAGSKECATIIEQAVNSYHYFWHGFFLTYMRGAMLELYVRAELANKRMTKKDAYKLLEDFGFNSEYIKDYIFKQRMPESVRVSRYTFRNQIEVYEDAYDI